MRNNRGNDRKPAVPGGSGDEKTHLSARSVTARLTGQKGSEVSMRGKRELPRKRPPFLLFVLIFAAGFLAGTLFWHFRPFDASVPSGGTATLPDTSAGTEVSGAGASPGPAAGRRTLS